MGGFVWLLQWPIRALVLLLITYLPLGVEMSSFPVALLAAVVIGLLGSLLILPLKALFALPLVAHQLWRAAAAGELAVQLDHHRDPVRPGRLADRGLSAQERHL